MLVEEQRFAQPDDQVQLVAWRQLQGIDLAQGGPGGTQLSGIRGGPEALEPGPPDDQRGRGADRRLDRLGRVDGLLEPALVVVRPGRRQRVGNHGGGRLGRRRHRQHEEHEGRGRQPSENRIRHSLL